MTRFRKKPVEIDAVQFIGNNEEILAFCPDAFFTFSGELVIKTLEGRHEASFKDWIIKGVKGEFYPCKPDVFALTYELVVA